MSRWARTEADMALPLITAPADSTSQRAGARRSPVLIDWVRSDLARDAAPPPPWAYDGLMVFSTDSGLPWYVGELPARWLARHQGLALTTVNLNIAADAARLRGIPSDTGFYFDTQAANLMVASVRSVIRASGGRLLVSCDEEFWTLPPWIPEGAGHPELIQHVERSLTEADHVVVFSARMADRVTRFNRSIRVIPHALPALDQLPRPPAPRGRRGIRIGWAGSQSHRGDLEMIGPAVLQLLAQRPDVTFVLAGQACEVPWAWTLRGSAQIDLHPGAGYLPGYYRWIASLDLDGFVTPLVEHPFNAVKPCLKPLEAAGLGLPVIASTVGAYAEELRHEETALLVANTTEAWLAALLRLVDDADLRAHLSAGGRAWAATRTIESTGPLWAELWGR